MCSVLAFRSFPTVTHKTVQASVCHTMENSHSCRENTNLILLFLLKAIRAGMPPLSIFLQGNPSRVTNYSSSPKRSNVCFIEASTQGFGKGSSVLSYLQLHHTEKCLRKLPSFDSVFETHIWAVALTLSTLRLEGYQSSSTEPNSSSFLRRSE